MSIQNNDPNTFFELLKSAIPCFRIFKKSNYTNSCELSLLQWNCWKKFNHPIIPFLESNFKACSEEYGESAIHTLMTHIRDSNYTGDNLAKQWEESRIANYYFSKLPKECKNSRNTTKWYKFNNPGFTCISSYEVFIDLENDIVTGQRLPFKAVGKRLHIGFSKGGYQQLLGRFTEID